MNKWISEAKTLAKAAESYTEGGYEASAAVCTERIEAGEDDRAAALLLRAMCFAAMDKGDDAQYDHGRGVVMLGDISDRDYLVLAEEAMDNRMPLDYCAAMLSRAAQRLFTAKDALPAANAWNKAGVCYYRLGQLEHEVSCFNKAITILEDYIGKSDPETGEEQPSDGERLSSGALLALVRANLAECCVRQENMEKAQRLYLDAAEGFEAELAGGDLFIAEHYALCRRNLSEIYRAKLDNVTASKSLTCAIDALEKHRDECPPHMKLQLSGCYNARGTLRYQMGDYDGEVSDCTRSLDLREELGDTLTDYESTATVYFNRAEAYGELKMHAEETADYLRGIAELEKSDSDAVRMILNIRRLGLGRVYSEYDEHANACEQYMLAAGGFAALREKEFCSDAQVREQVSEMEAMCRYSYGMGCCIESRRNYYDSATQFRLAIELLESLLVTPDRADRLCTVYNSLGELYEMFDEYEKARECYLSVEHYRTVTVLDELAAERHGDTLYDAPGDCFSDADTYSEGDVENEDDVWEYSDDDTPQA